ncbi:MAG: hypothetical protein CMJ70_01185 [Planctomycetaceae bacterium]|nr:hypothetical protein [Planctomycetaceae bacterium]
MVPGHINSITGMRTYVSFLTDGLAKPIDVGGLPAGDRALGGFSASAKTHYKDSIVGKVPNSGDFPHARFVRGQHLGRKKANPNGTSIQFNANGLPVVPSGYHFSAGDWFFRYAGNDQPMALYPAKQGFCILEPTAGAFSPFCLIALSSLAHPTNAPIRLDVTSLQFDNVAKKIRLTPVMTRDLDDLLRSENLLGAGAAFKRELLPMPPDPLVSSGGAELDLSIYDTIPLQFAVRPNETRELFNNAVRMFDLLSVLEAIRQREKIHKVKRDGAKAHTAAKRHALEQVAMKVKAGIERDLILNARDDRAFQRALVVLTGTQPRQLVLQIKQAFQDWQEALRVQKDTEQQIFGKPALVGQQNLLNQMAAWFMQRNDPISKGIAAKFNAIHKSGNLWEAQRVVQQLKNMQTAAANGTLQQVADWMNFCASHDFLLRLRAPDGQTFPLIYFKR